MAKLYLKHGYFLCRHCHDLAYSSQREGRQEAALRRCQRIRQKLGGSAKMAEPFPDRPKGMHHKTYWGLFLEYEKANQEYTQAMLEDLERLTG